MFSKKNEHGHAEQKTAQSAVSAMPDKPARPVSAVPALATVAKVPVLNDVVSSSTKSSTISEGFEFTGDMKSDGSLTVDGAIVGNLVVHTLFIGATGMVDGSVKAESVNVEGCLSGAVECKDLSVGGKAVVDGHLAYSTLAIQRGATIKGELKRA